MDRKLWVITTTFPSADEARRVARALVEERLAACVQIDAPMRSVYRWQGQVEEADEVRMTIKTTRKARERLIARLCALHSYETPQVLAWPAEAQPDYYAWAVACCEGEGSD